ncbi:hypothetical protein [Campylobacter curvus]|uniref:SMODS and SLOG-associating 2TM effector domain-containing protein n=1 Tax=Campylobacter curvus (strain 525.92) TaxID=360105 RepID=A7GY85_CAMC5|nr:hypothetical protein [Campylobacter curvus]EAU00202.1 hypothetical protein CCV52592_1308 [Campylobacter curvus 525.92]
MSFRNKLIKKIDLEYDEVFSNDWEISNQGYEDYQRIREKILEKINWVNKEKKVIYHVFLAFFVYFVLFLIIFCGFLELSSTGFVLSFLFAWQKGINRDIDRSSASDQYTAVLLRWLERVDSDFIEKLHAEHVKIKEEVTHFKKSTKTD